MPRLIATILCFLLAAPAWCQDIGPTHPVMMGARKGLVRSGLVGAWNLGSVNLLRWSEDLSNAAWSSLHTVTATSSLTPDGYSATKLTPVNTYTDAYTQQSIVATSGILYTLSLRVKADGFTWAAFSIYDTGHHRAWVNLSTGAVGTTGSGVSISTSDLGSGWYLVKLSYTVGATTIYVNIRAADADNSEPTGDAIKAIIVGGVQLNEGATAANYQGTLDLQRVPVGTSGSMPIRREIGGQVIYDPAPDAASKFTYADGETRSVIGTNLLTYSEDLSNAAWTKVLGSAAGNIVTSSGVDTSVRQSALVQNGKSYILLVKVKTGSGTNTVRLSAASSSFITIGYTEAVLTTEYSTISLSFVANDSTIYIQLGGFSQWTSGEALEFQYWQLNPGTLPDQYQKTEATALEPGYPFLQLGSTAAADTNDPARRLSGMVFDGTDDYLTSSATIPASGSLGAVFNSNNTAGYGVLVGPGVSNNALELFLDPFERIRFGLDGSATGELFYAVGASTWASVIGARSTTVNSLYLNGASVASDVPSAGTERQMRVGANAGGVNFSGTISHVLLYDRALSPREVRQNHQWLKSQMANVGVSLP